MKKYHPIVRWMTVGLFAAALFTGVVFINSAKTMAYGSSSQCLDPKDIWSYEGDFLTRTKGTITTVDGKPLCTDGKLVVTSFKVPDTWDKKGWNRTAIPQTLFATKSFTFPAGKTNHTMTLEIAAPEACKNTQLDFYLAPGYQTVDGLHSDDELNVTGELFAATKDCEKPVVKDITVCVLETKITKTIKENEFDARKHSKVLKDCEATPVVKDLRVCVLATKTVVTIKENEFDSTKHSKVLTDCNVAPVVEDLRVCVLATKTVITIKENEFDSTKHSKVLTDCSQTPAKETTPVQAKPEVLPNTGTGSVIGIVVLAGFVSYVLYYLHLRRSLKQ